MDDRLAQFAARVGNEINNPLAAVLAAHSYLRRRIDGSDLAGDVRVREFLDIVDAELEATARIVDDLIDFGVARPVRRSAALLREVVAEAGRAVTWPRGVRLENGVSEALEPVHIDRDKTHKVLVQLLRNAAAASPGAGGVVTVTGELRSDRIVLTIADQGDGVAPEVADRLREPLFTSRAKGLGLGLAIADALTRAQGGELSWENVAAGGSAFSVRLPAA